MQEQTPGSRIVNRRERTIINMLARFVAAAVVIGTIALQVQGTHAATDSDGGFVGAIEIAETAASLVEPLFEADDDPDAVGQTTANALRAVAPPANASGVAWQQHHAASTRLHRPRGPPIS
ncbi:MAG: hypothetical protein ACI9OJ_001570 [Myxococcota bacterium]|jgi:hypothetical protein